MTDKNKHTHPSSYAEVEGKEGYVTLMGYVSKLHLGGKYSVVCHADFVLLEPKTQSADVFACFLNPAPPGGAPVSADGAAASGTAAPGAAGAPVAGAVAATVATGAAESLSAQSQPQSPATVTSTTPASSVPGSTASSSGSKTTEPSDDDGPLGITGKRKFTE